MNIISWNVNGIRAIENKGFLEWLTNEAPNIICLQETKAHPEQLSSHLKNPVCKDGTQYKSFWASAQKKGYSGVCVFTKTEPLDVSFLGIKEFDDEGRGLQLSYKDFVLICAYFPNSKDGGSRLQYKLDFCGAMLERCKALAAKGKNVILCGDYNIAHKPIDLARPKENENNAGYLPEERAWMDVFTGNSFIDTFRHFYPDEPDKYTWWSYRTRARERNVGWRLDYFCVDSQFISKVESSAIMANVDGSDHCPIKLSLKL
ncbi:MAG: exodeoxyribonuclease III [Spirochaetaceae bacterium]|jgi:exodeoxyribonuclease-3|nr:exodeoxyribonuclease III [Spirochaetaceae bacterium]